VVLEEAVVHGFSPTGKQLPPAGDKSILQRYKIILLFAAQIQILNQKRSSNGFFGISVGKSSKNGYQWFFCFNKSKFGMTYAQINIKRPHQSNNT
jgi:hypothetical protein